MRASLRQRQARPRQARPRHLHSRVADGPFCSTAAGELSLPAASAACRAASCRLRRSIGSYRRPLPDAAACVARARSTCSCGADQVSGETAISSRLSALLHVGRVGREARGSKGEEGEARVGRKGGKAHPIVVEELADDGGAHGGAAHEPGKCFQQPPIGNGGRQVADVVARVP